MKRYVALLIVSALASSSEAQSLMESLYRKSISTSSSIIVKSVQPALMLIRQQYRLEHGGNYYGKNGHQYYGESFTLGVKVDGATILHRSAIAPWETDEDYLNINKDNKYTPQRLLTFQRAISDSVWLPVDLELNTRFVVPANKDSVLYLHLDRISDFGISIDNSFGDKKGYVIWAYSDTADLDSASQVTLRQQNLDIVFQQDMSPVSLSPIDDSNIIGGVFVVPSFERPGIIKITFAGLASKSRAGEWQLFPIGEAGNPGYSDGEGALYPYPSKPSGTPGDIGEKGIEPTLIK